jgi:hypothetical protein
MLSPYGILKSLFQIGSNIYELSTEKLPATLWASHSLLNPAEVAITERNCHIENNFFAKESIFLFATNDESDSFFNIQDPLFLFSAIDSDESFLRHWFYSRPAGISANCMHRKKIAGRARNHSKTCTAHHQG